MGRNSAISTELLIKLIEEFYTLKCNKDSSLLKIPAIGSYIRSKGYPVQDYILRRNELAREYINKLRTTTEDTYIRSVSVYRDIDMDTFLQKNNTLSKLKKALVEREGYYREITNSAAYSFKENKEIKVEIKDLKNLNSKLMLELKQEIENRKIIESKNRQVINENKRLREIIDTYIYPEIANELLKKSGLINETAGVVNENIINNTIISADTNITKIRNTVVKGLFDRL